MKKLVIGMLAHVDAGKTTLSESILYTSGAIRKLGRVDNKDAFLDNNDYERQRGITIFSKQAVFTYKDLDVTLLDTPGHVDFSAEMERTLWVLDYAVLVINGMDGVQGHTETLWGLLKRLKVPVFIFVNKMDQQGTDRHRILEQLKNKLSSGCVDFDRLDYEELAVCNEEALEQVLEEGIVDDKLIGNMISQREVFPVIFGSALRLNGMVKCTGYKPGALEDRYSSDGVFLYDRLNKSDMEMLELAIRCHNMYRIPQGLNRREQAFCNVLRDADKVDIFKVNIDTPLEEIYNTTTEELMKSDITDEVLKAFDEEHCILKAIRRTPADTVIGHVSLAYELVYDESVRITVEQGYLAKLMHFHSDNEETNRKMAMVREKMDSYVKKRIGEKDA